MTSDSQPSKLFDHIHVQQQLLYTKSFIKILSKATHYQLYLGVCAKVKRLCKAMLRFMRSLRNSSGEWRGEFRGEPQGDILGDPQGEPDTDRGLLRGNEPASTELPQRASLMLPFTGPTKPDLLCWSLQRS